MANVFMFRCQVCNNHNYFPVDPNLAQEGQQFICPYCKTSYTISKKPNKENLWGGLIAGAITGAALGGIPGAAIGGIIGAGLGSTSGTSAIPNDQDDKPKWGSRG